VSLLETTRLFGCGSEALTASAVSNDALRFLVRGGVVVVYQRAESRLCMTRPAAMQLCVGGSRGGSKEEGRRLRANNEGGVDS